MIVLPCCDAQDRLLHRKYLVIDVRVCVSVCVRARKREKREEQPIRMKGSCGIGEGVLDMFVAYVCLRHRWGDGYQLPPRGSHKCTRLALTVPLPLI